MDEVDGVWLYYSCAAEKREQGYEEQNMFKEVHRVPTHLRYWVGQLFCQKFADGKGIQLMLQVKKALRSVV